MGLTLDSDRPANPDNDFYAFRLTTVPVASDAIIVTPSAGIGARLNVRILDSDGTTQLLSASSSSKSTNPVSLSLAGLTANKRYFVHVSPGVTTSGVVDATATEYTLQYVLAATSDLAEPNDSDQQRTELGNADELRIVSGATIHAASDVDWYGFTLRATGGTDDRILINSQGAGVPVTLQLLNAAGGVLGTIATTAGSSSSVSISLRDLVRGDYQLKVSALVQRVIS